MTNQELIFAMDIGTRTVVGIVGYHDGSKFKIVAYDVEEHKERAMYDGQVHDIDLVARAAGRVKERLEKKLSVPLKRVAIAAAGRSLKTCKVFIEQEAEAGVEIDREVVSSLEIEGIQKAQSEIEKQQHEDDTVYYCVGYAVVNYFLNGNIIGNLEGHKAKKVGIEVLATFLPRVVVDSLYAVITRVGLEVSSLTLEPIAAMNVSIHSSLRLLNIALVDIGAGTSDIALTKGGTVFAFAMAPIAGDEITEKIAENYLLDFENAEKVKISLCDKETIKYKDVMGLQHEKSSEEIIAAIEPSIKMLAQEIASRVLEYNGKAPSAVFLIGGGSKIPHLPELLAEYLQIPVERVGVRKTDVLKDVEIKSKKLAGPEFITPIGIAVTAHQNRQKDFLQVSVNNINVKLFNSKTLTVADALILIGYNPRNLIGRRGNAVNFEINGKTESVKGEHGESAKIFVNGTKSSLDQSIMHGDNIVVDPAVDGKMAEIHLKDYITLSESKHVYLDGKRITLRPAAWINGDRADIDAAIHNGDKVTILSMNTLSDLLRAYDMPDKGITLLQNGKKAELQDIINDGDTITSVYVGEEDAATSENTHKEILVWVNEKPITLNENKWQYIFVDIFNYINIDLKNIQGRLILQLNGASASYTDILQDGDKIVVEWEK